MKRYRIRDETLRKPDNLEFWESFLTNVLFSIFDFEGIEDDKQEAMLKRELLLNGRVCFFRHNGEMYNLPFTDGGKVGVYNPIIYKALVVNPVLTNIPNMDDGESCKLVYLTYMDKLRCNYGYYGLIHRTALQLCDNDLTVQNIQFLKRLNTVFVAKTDSDFGAMKALIDSIKRGVTAVIAKTKLSGQIDRLDGSGSFNLSEHTEYQQYVLATFYNMLGVPMQWNNKRERVTAAETMDTEATSFYNVYSISEYIKKQLDEVNTMFGTQYLLKLNIETEGPSDPEETESEEGENSADVDES